MFIALNPLKTKPETRAQALTIVEEIAADFKRTKGCRYLQLWRQGRSDNYLLVIAWEDLSYYQKAAKSPRYANNLAKLEPVLAEPIVLPIGYEVVSGVAKSSGSPPY